LEDISAQAKKTILKNVKKGTAATSKGPFEYTYICPSKSVYPHQWLWDSCFHTITTSRFNRQLAKAELRTLASRIQDNGFTPQITIWKPNIQLPVASSIARLIHHHSHYTHVTQPPVFGVALEEVYRNSGDRSFLEDLLPKAKRHYEYWLENRDPDGDGLVSIILPIESGMDHSPAYDDAMRLAKPTALNYHIANMVLAAKYAGMGWNTSRILDSELFSVEDLTVNSIFAYGLRSVARLCRQIGDPDDARFDALALRTEKAVVDRCYDPSTGVFYSLAGKEDRRIPVKTIASLMPLMLESMPEHLVKEMVDKHLLNPDFFWLDYPVPSVSMGQEQFSACAGSLSTKTGIAGIIERGFDRFQTIWRGPTWVNMNWFLGRGLRIHGYEELADELTARTVKMISKAGFWEYYNPLTGEGQGAGDFSWTCIVLDMLDTCSNPEATLAASDRKYYSGVEMPFMPAAPALS
jgi:glycogen debranching enzyme